MDDSTADTATDHSINAAANAFASILAPDEPGTREEGEALDAPDTEEDVDPAEDADETEAEEDEADPDADEEDEDGDEPETPVYTIKVNGEEIQVTLEELQKGYSRTQDYTRKTQQLAEMRKAAEAEAESIRGERAQYTRVLDAMRQQLEAAPAQIDWDRLRQEDPIEFAARWAENQQKQQRLQAIQAEQARMAEIQQREQMQQMSQVVAREREILTEVIPEWRDLEVAKREKAELVTFGKKLGFETQELAEITDHRAVVALRKAYLYDKMMSVRAKAKPAASPTLKPGATSATTKTNELTRAKQRLAKTGNVQDAAAAFESLLLGRG
jgi:hypothetical protein